MGLCKWRHARFPPPGKPTDNAFIEAFNGRLRAECLSANWFMSLPDAREKLECWRRDLCGWLLRCKGFLKFRQALVGS